MKNYVIINGVNSLTITGLAISKLPSISKPPLRVMTEEINGRDGDLITELGYGAYDKELVVGLYGNYDINEVIGFFNQEGTIVFSNENDKYYNFKIINQIDYEALIKFRTATINLHCQPFKYPLTETPEEITTEYVEDEGETITLNDTKIAPLSIDLKGNTTQNGTPTPSSPINVNVVSGDNSINVVGKNLFNTNFNTTTSNGITFTYNNDKTITIKGTSTASANVVVGTATLQAGTYIASANMQYAWGKSRIEISGSGSTIALFDTNKSNTITLSTETTLTFRAIVSGTGTVVDYTIGIMLEKGTTATEYEPYTSQNYPLYLGVENLFDKDNPNVLIAYISASGVISANSTDRVIWMPIKANTDYTFQMTQKALSTATSQDDMRIALFSTQPIIGATGTIEYSVSRTSATSDYYLERTFNSGNNTYVAIKILNTQKSSYDDTIATIQLTKGSTPQHTSTQPIELCKIGTYQDYIYKDSGKWYLHKEIGKLILNGNSALSSYVGELTNVYIFQYSTTSFANITSTGGGLCNILSSIVWSYSNGTESYYLASDTFVFKINRTLIDSQTGDTTLNKCKTYLNNTNLIMYGPLKTAEDIEITNTTLMNQLEDLKGAMSYEGQTNISQVNNDLPFILKVKGTKEGSGEGIINNIGNIYAKPIIELEGTGNIGIYKNGTQYFEVDMSSDNEITIDTEKMEAYHNGVLKNRKVIGDYNKFTIDKGNNNIEITGELTKATISNYTRWL